LGWSVKWRLLFGWRWSCCFYSNNNPTWMMKNRRVGLLTDLRLGFQKSLSSFRNCKTSFYFSHIYFSSTETGHVSWMEECHHNWQRRFHTLGITMTNLTIMTIYNAGVRSFSLKYFQHKKQTCIVIRL
jgi:hypothetical protein